jgi:hypothetical protein
VNGRSKPRRQGVKPTVGLVVEGDTEYEALPLLYREGLVSSCPPLKASNVGGVGSHREQRPDCPGALAQAVQAALHQELARKGKPCSNVSVVVSDRAFEAWILADAKGLHAKGAFSRAPSFASFEGKMGRENKKGVVDVGSENSSRSLSGNSCRSPKEESSSGNTAARGKKRPGRGKGCST